MRGLFTSPARRTDRNMPTIMEWVNEDGTAGRCDSRCQNARLPECECRCGGKFHGAGRAGTLTEKLAETTPEALAQMAATPRTNGIVKMGRKKRPNGKPRAGSGGRQCTQWEQVEEARWITVQQLLTTMPPGEIVRRDNDSHILSVAGAKQHASAHTTLERAQSHYERVIQGV